MRGTYSVRTRRHMQRKWCRHCTYNANDSPSFVFIASQKTQSESHDKINWRPLRYRVFIFPKYFANVHFLVSWNNIFTMILDRRFLRRINGASNPSIVVYLTICLLSKHRSRERHSMESIAKNTAKRRSGDESTCRRLYPLHRTSDLRRGVKK